MRHWDDTLSNLSERGRAFVVKGKRMPRPKRLRYSPHYPGADPPVKQAG